MTDPILSQAARDAAQAAFDKRIEGYDMPKAFSMRRAAPVPMTDKRTLHLASVAAIGGSVERGISPPQTIQQLATRLASVCQLAEDMGHRLQKPRLARAVAQAAAIEAVQAAQEMDGLQIELGWAKG